MSESIQIQSRDYWFKVIEMLQQNWALVDSSPAGATVYFVNDASGVFDEMSFDSPADAEAALHTNGFARYADDSSATAYLRRPEPPFTVHPHPNGPIYSSGRFWKSSPPPPKN